MKRFRFVSVHWGMNRSSAHFMLAGYLAVTLSSGAYAVPYASGVRNVTGSSWEFVLNEEADRLTIKRDGGDPIDIPNPTAGRYTFDLAGFTTFDIEVEKEAPEGLVRTSDGNNPFAAFRRPNGLAVNRDPTSPFFGTIYVANSIAGSTQGSLLRTVGDGIYSLTADLRGVNLSTASWPVPNPNDPGQAKVAPIWQVGNQTAGSGNNSPFRIALDDGGNVIVGDWSDANGGLKYLNADLTGGGLVLDLQEGPDFGAVDRRGPFDGSGSPFIHGSIRSQPNVTGTVGVNLVVSAIDEDLNRNPVGLFDGTYPNPSLPGTNSQGFPTDGNHVWEWNVGNEIKSRAKPTLLIDVGASNAPGDNQLGSDTNGGPYQFDLNFGIRANAEFFPQIGDQGLWVLTEPRTFGDSSGIVFVEVDRSGAEPVASVLWSSKQFTIDNGLDGFPNDTRGLFSPDPHNDVFRNTGTVEVSADGSTLYVHRWAVDDSNNPAGADINPYLGSESEYPGAILAIPLNENGLPMIQIDDNGTPNDPSDDLFTNLESVATTSGNAVRQQYELTIDAAGNLITTDGANGLVETFSPGGHTLTTFSFDGVSRSFSVVQIPEPSGMSLVLAIGTIARRYRRAT